MRSHRRMRFYGIIVVTIIFVVLYMSRAAHQTRSSEFYVKTQQALKEQKQLEDVAKQRDADGVASRLKAAEEQAKKAADKKYDSVVGVGEGTEKNGVAGRVKLDKELMPGVAQQGGSRDQAIAQDNETAEEHETEMELNSILKQSPIIIFSKTYCRFSKKAKHILLDKYRIVPAPYVVELDTHPRGPGLLSLLAKSTGRRTVPNVLVMGKSIGGGDDVEELDQTNTLVTKIRDMGGSRITEVELRRARPEIRSEKKKA